ncbi:MAG: replicative DNA helicase [Candidatus Dojkabacteria bacterium]
MAQDKFKIPPHNSEAEKSILGGILLDDEKIMDAAEIISAKDFYDSRLGTIFEAMIKLFEKQSPIDVLTVTNQLKAKKKFKEVGGAAVLSEIVAETPTAAHTEEYAKIVKQNSIRRQMIALGAKINEFAFDEKEEVENLLDKVEQQIFEISETAVERDFTHISLLLEKTYEQAEQLANNPDALRGIPTGFRDVDKILGGMQNSDLVILAARPSVGKTAFSIDIARHIATAEERKVGFFSLEMSNAQLMDRLLAQEVGVGLWKLRTGQLQDNEFADMAEAMGRLSESGLYFDDTPGLSIMEMRTKARKLKMEHGLDMVIVDYLQLMQGNTKENRTQEVSEISRFLKNLARELDVPVLALSQLSRAVENRADRIPQLSDLRESGSIEQDADVVIFLHREETFDPDTERKGIGDLIVAKHRNGPTGQVELAFIHEQARYRDLDARHSA